MKKNLALTLVLFLFFALTACGRSTEDLVESAQNIAGDVADSVNDELSGTSQEEEAMAECDLDAMELSANHDATLHLINKTGETLSFSWLDITQNPPALADRGQIENGGTFIQGTTPGHVFVANNVDGMPVFEYAVTADEKQCAIIESTDPIELTLVPTEAPAEGPTGETVTVDPTQPIAVEDSNGTQLSVGANELVDENGNPPAGDVQVNTYTPDVADDGDSTACEEALTVWSYNPETGLWEEEGTAPYQDDRCVDSLGTVSVNVSDDAGTEYDLADGATAEVSIPCEPAPDEVLTVWSYDETIGLWVEEGPVIQEGERCSAEVSDVSNVNFVAQDPVSGMQGQVVDLDSSEPLVGGQVCVQGTEQCASVDESGMYTLAELDPAEYVFEVTATDYVTATQTISLAAGETLSQDFALIATNPVLAVLSNDVVLRGSVVVVSNSQGAKEIEVGDIYVASIVYWNQNFPDYNITSVDAEFGVLVNEGADGQISIIIPNRSETEIGKAANANLEGVTLRVTAVGETNQPVKADDVMEVVLTDPNSSNLPYTVNFYRGEGEARMLVTTFTIDKQQ